MKGLVLSTLAGLIIASVGSSYADIIRFTTINESANAVNLIMPDSHSSVVSRGAVKMFSANYNYPAPILYQGSGQFPQKCEWSMQPVGKQTIKTMTLNIANDSASRKQTCLISWQ